MSISYTPTTWVNLSPPAISATNLTNMENGIAALAAIVPPSAYPFVGQLIESEIALTPSSTVPVIARWDADHDVASSGAGGSPTLVTAFRAQKAGLGLPYTTDITGVTSANSAGDTDLTFPNTGFGIAMVNAITNEGLVSGWFSSNQNPGFGADFAAASSQLCLNYNGTDYLVKATTPVSRIVKLASVNLGVLNSTAIVYPYRIYNDATKARLRRLTGFMPASTGDSDGLIANGLRVMDQMQGHYHTGPIGPPTRINSGSIGAATYGLLAANSDTGALVITSPYTDGTNGIPRTGKMANPRSSGIFLYTWAGTLI